MLLPDGPELGGEEEAAKINLEFNNRKEVVASDPESDKDDFIRELEHERAYQATNREYKKRQRCVRKRDKKGEDKLSNGSTGQSSSAAAAAIQMIKSNFIEDIQELKTPEDAQIVLAFNSVQCVFLTLMQRAKLFVKLKYSTDLRHQKFKQAVR